MSRLSTISNEKDAETTSRDEVHVLGHWSAFRKWILPLLWRRLFTCVFCRFLVSQHRVRLRVEVWNFKIARFSRFAFRRFVLLLVDDAIESHFKVCTIFQTELITKRSSSYRCFIGLMRLFRFALSGRGCRSCACAPDSTFFSTEKSLKSEDTVS